MAPILTRPRSTKAKLALAMVMLATLACGPTAAAAEIGQMEKYVLAEDQDEFLAGLIPGSDDHFFFHCLHHQTQGNLAAAEAVIVDWLAEKKGRPTTQIQQMLDRQRLLTYDGTPQQTIDYFIKRLGIKLDHAAPPAKGERRYPTSLPPAVLNVDQLIKNAVRANAKLKPAGQRHLGELFLANKTGGFAITLRTLLAQIDAPIIDNLDELVIRELKSRKPTDVKFGDLSAHAQLTLDQLNRVAAQVPAVADDGPMINAVLGRLRPSADTDPSQQPDVRHDYLTRVEAYVGTLPASHNGIKAAALYRLLESNLTRGVYDRSAFLRYLDLPRTSPIVHRDHRRLARGPANLQQDYMRDALLPAINDEQPLVRAHLEHFLKNAKSTADFDALLTPEYLRRVFAETKLMAGIGDEQKWYRMLSATHRSRLRDAVELRMSAQNKIRFPADTAPSLRVAIKNVPELVVRIYQINAPSYFRSSSKPIDTDIDLDGLVATHQRTLTYNQPGIIRHTELIDLPELSQRGVWIIDLVGAGVRARALVRRGSIDHVQSPTADGTLLTIIDENRAPIAGATLLIGGQLLTADDNGRINVAPLKTATDRKVVISDGTLARSISFKHAAESYSLTCGMHLDRSLIQSGMPVDVLIRSRLHLGTSPVALAVLKDVSAVIEATDLGGIKSTQKIDDVAISQTGETVLPIRAPARLAKLSVTLSGTVRRLSDGVERPLSSTHQWDIASIRTSNQTVDAFLTRRGSDYSIELRGRSGELVPGGSLSVKIRNHYCVGDSSHTLQADDQGRIQLGTLAGASSIDFGVPGGIRHHRDLRLDHATRPDRIHTTTDNKVSLALANDLAAPRSAFRLVSVREGRTLRDHSDKLAADDGLLTISPLPAGDYQLIELSTGTKTPIDVVDGPLVGRVAAGETRQRYVSPQLPLGVASIRQTAAGLTIKLSGDTKLARVHLFAGRYLDGLSPLQSLWLPGLSLPGRSVALQRCGYISDLRLGDEYQYVLRRRYADKYPGVMLPQPGLLLNPWQTEETTNTSQVAAAGQQPQASAPMSAEARFDAEAADRMRRQGPGSSDFDFQADPGVVLANLQPAADGTITIPADVIGDLPLVQFVVCDPITMIQRTVSMTTDGAAPKPNDLRLSESLDPDQPLTFLRSVQIASAETPLDLAKIGAAQMQLFRSVGDLQGLYKTLVGDARFADFDVLMTWHTLDVAAKQAAYTRLASHELHLFLHQHDRQFFDSVVRTFLANKKEKQFVDRWLLGEDLTAYTELWQYNQLNAAEKALLAIRAGDTRATIIRELSETTQNRDINPAALRRLIENALASDKTKMDGGAANDPFGAVQDNASASQWSSVSAERISLGVPAPGGMGGGGTTRSMSRRAAGAKITPKLGKSLGRGSMFFGGRAFTGGTFFQPLDTTKQWAESHWDRVRTVGGPEPAKLISTNAFWRDLAARTEAESAVSGDLLQGAENYHAALVALAFCGLPLESDAGDLPRPGDKTFAPATPVAVVSKSLQTLRHEGDAGLVLIGQRFAASAASQDDDAELDEFLTGTAYTGTVVVSNPTAKKRIVNVFWQIPAGSLPLAGGRSTDSKIVELGPFAVQSLKYEFYFPAAGQFTHYPANVSSDDLLLSQSSPRTFRVVDEPTKIDTTSWPAVARSGTPEQIRTFLDDANLRDLNLMLVAHRLSERAVFDVVSEIARVNRIGNRAIFAYGFKHNDTETIATYLSLHEDLARRVGPVFASTLLNVSPVQRRFYEHLEYTPLVRARIHRLGNQNEILNPTLLRQYQSFVNNIGFRGRINDDDRLSLCYYLLIQNRIGEAIRHFDLVRPEAVETDLQFDYMDAFLALHQSDHARAAEIAGRHLEHPIPRWRQRFTLIASHVRQHQNLVAGKSDQPDDASDSGTQAPGELAVIDRELRNQSAAAARPNVVAGTEDSAIRVDHQRASSATVNVYGVDLELLFSKAPFVRENLQRMAMVKPMASYQVDFDTPDGTSITELADELKSQTLLIEVVAGAARSTTLYYGGQLRTYVSAGFGQLQTTHAQTGHPVAAAYVKVYAKSADGKTRFHKDGYTDARGRFDYVSVSATSGGPATRYAILVLDEQHGATLHDVGTPNQ